MAQAHDLDTLTQTLEKQIKASRDMTLIELKVLDKSVREAFTRNEKEHDEFFGRLRADEEVLNKFIGEQAAGKSSTNKQMASLTVIFVAIQAIATALMLHYR